MRSQCMKSSLHNVMHMHHSKRLNHNFTISQFRNIIISQFYNFTVPQFHNFTISQFHNFITSQRHKSHRQVLVQNETNDINKCVAPSLQYSPLTLKEFWCNKFSWTSHISLYMCLGGMVFLHVYITYAGGQTVVYVVPFKKIRNKCYSTCLPGSRSKSLHISFIAALELTLFLFSRHWVCTHISFILLSWLKY